MPGLEIECQEFREKMVGKTVCMDKLSGSKGEKPYVLQWRRKKPLGWGFPSPVPFSSSSLLRPPLVVSVTHADFSFPFWTLWTQSGSPVAWRSVSREGAAAVLLLRPGPRWCFHSLCRLGQGIDNRAPALGLSAPFVQKQRAIYLLSVLCITSYFDLNQLHLKGPFGSQAAQNSKDIKSQCPPGTDTDIVACDLGGKKRKKNKTSN